MSHKYEIIHLSDIHIGKSHIESRRAHQLVRYIGKLFPERPVVVTGDITDSGTERQFKRAKEIFKMLSSTNPVLLVPGNHDYAFIGNFCHDDAWKNWVNLLGCPLGWGGASVPWLEEGHEPENINGLGVWKDEDVVFFGIDSGDPSDEVISARGWISEKLSVALKQSLEQYQGKFRVAMLHHHPFTSSYFTALKGSERLMDALNGNCELLLFGHDHNYGIWREDPKIGIPLVIASHKSTACLSGKCGMISLIDINTASKEVSSINHKLEVIPFS